MDRTLFDPPFDGEQHFDGNTYDPWIDQSRLGAQLNRVFSVMRDGIFLTLEEIQRRTKRLREDGGIDSLPAISARIRDFRKDKFGACIVDSIRLRGGLWVYRLRRRGTSYIFEQVSDQGFARHQTKLRC